MVRAVEVSMLQLASFSTECCMVEAGLTLEESLRATMAHCRLHDGWSSSCSIITVNAASAQKYTLRTRANVQSCLSIQALQQLSCARLVRSRHMLQCCLRSSEAAVHFAPCCPHSGCCEHAWLQVRQNATDCMRSLFHKLLLLDFRRTFYSSKFGYAAPLILLAWAVDSALWRV